MSALVSVDHAFVFQGLPLVQGAIQIVQKNVQQAAILANRMLIEVCAFVVMARLHCDGMPLEAKWWCCKDVR